MEAEARETSVASANAESVHQENQIEGSKRKAGPVKRKGLSSLSSSSAPPPSKRLAKERYPSPFPPPVHNGPITRARQSPNKLAAAAAAASAPQKPPEQTVAPEVTCEKETAPSGELVAVEYEDLAPPEAPVVDAEFEAVRSRNKNVHVVPTPAGWFSWRKIHPLEERAMPSFFDGKSEKRTSDVYLEIRNWIMKKFHADPQMQIELKDLSELSAGDSDARQEVMEFLDYWGLINFHPFPPTISNTSAHETEREAKTSSLTEKLYHFEMVHPYGMSGSKKMDLSTQAQLPRLAPESAIADDLVRPEGPSVEYHCNSCSADCSRKRYHCQKQADFDLCTECYNEGKFGSGMSAADFILMESAEGPGVSGGSWTDQETLLLLEALELYGENWNEIAEHVATKTKAQCILHFVEMPIEDPFLVGREDFDVSLPVNTDRCSTNKDLVASNVSEAMENDSVDNGDQPISSSPDISKRKDGSGAGVNQEVCSSIAVDALKAAFQAVCSLPEQGGLLSFVESGNPVMALVAFLVGIVEPDGVTTSSRSSLKAMSEDSSGIQLATRHCFPLEDPPNDGKDPSIVADDQIACESGEAQKGEDQIQVLNGTDEMKDCTEKNTENAVPLKKESSVSSEECTQNHTAKESGDLTLSKEVTHDTVKESGVLSLLEEQVACTNVKGDSASKGEDTRSAMVESGNLSLDEEVTPSTKKDNTDLALPLEGELNSGVTSVKEVKQCLEASMSVDIVAKSVAVDGEVHPQTAGASSTTEIRETTGEIGKKSVDGIDERNSSVETGDEINMSRIKRAAVTALSAAAVKAKLLANQEEDQIRELVTLVIEKQLQKLEMKLSLFTDIESMVMRVREHLDRSRQRLYHERAQIIAARLGLPASSSRAPPPSLPTSKFSTSYGPAATRQPNMASLRPPIKRP